MSKRRNVVMIFILALMFSISACGFANQESEPSSGMNLTDSEWILRLLNGSSLVEGTNITLTFEEDRIGGFAGCNSYGATYAIEGKSSIEIPMIESTLEGCLEPEGILEQESEYLELLMDADVLNVNEDQLEILDVSGNVILLYIKRAPLHMDPASLEGIEWRLLSMGGETLLEGSFITISFSDGKMQGHGGCRDYEGTYTAEGDHIAFLMISMLGDVCESDDLLIQEALYTDALELSTHYQIADGQLDLLTSTGETAIFEQVIE